MNMLQNFLSRLGFFSTDESKSESVSAINTNSVDYSKMKVVELKAEAKARGFTGYSSLKKAELVKLLGD